MMTATVTALVAATVDGRSSSSSSSNSGRRLSALAWFGTVPALSAADLTARL